MIEHVIYFVPVDNQFVILLLNVLIANFRVGKICLPLTEYRVFHSGVDYFEVKYLANPLPDLFQILHGEPGDMYN